MIGTSVGDLQLRLFTVFNFIFVAPGVLAQLQPMFIERRDIYEAREKKSKMYSVSSLPQLFLKNLTDSSFLSGGLSAQH